MTTNSPASVPEALGILAGFRGRSLLRVADLNPAEVSAIFTIARHLRDDRAAIFRPLADRIVCTLFFEPSTRTRLSFESAAIRLGASTLSVPDGRVTGAAKGESLSDIGRMLQAYADVVVLRHPDAESIHDIRRSGMTIPAINCGNGQQEHPTQALSDWFALTEAFPGGDPFHIGIIGVPSHMRTIRSFLLLGLAAFPHLIGRLTVISELETCLDAELRAAADAAGISVQVSDDLVRDVPQMDVLYVNSLTNVSGRYEFVNQRFQLSKSTPLKSTCRVLHPLARGPELDASLDDTEHNLYFQQSDNAVFVRQAILLAILGRLGDLVQPNGMGWDHERAINLQRCRR